MNMNEELWIELGFKFRDDLTVQVPMWQYIAHSKGTPVIFDPKKEVALNEVIKAIVKYEQEWYSTLRIEGLQQDLRNLLGIED